MPRDLIAGLRQFRHEIFPLYREHYARLVREGQKPTTLFIGCADSRVVPSLLTSSNPGELFVLRNVGNLVPPYEVDQGHHGTSAGIEFATLRLEVKDIIVCGHSHCGAVRSLYDPPLEGAAHIQRWLGLAREALLVGEPTDELLRRTEQRSIVLQLEHLMTYPSVRERVVAGALALHGWHYLLEEGRVLHLDVVRGGFVPLDSGPRLPSDPH
jgi:carbonic anhydrase